MADHDTHDHTGIPGVGTAVADILDIPTAEMDDTLVLAPDGAGGVEFRAETGGGGGGVTGLLPVQDKYTNFGSTNSGAITLGAGPTNGNILYLVSARDNGAAVSSVTQTNVTWTQITESTDTVAPKLEIWKGVAAASAGTGITVAYADTTYSAAHVSEWASTVPDTLDSSVILAGATGFGTWRQTALILPSDAGGLVIGVVTTTSNATRYAPMIGLTNFAAMVGTSDATFMCAFAFPGTTPVMGLSPGGGGTHGSLIVSLV